MEEHLDTPTDVQSLVGGRFHILSKLGEGGMGSVWLAQALGEERVAIKLMHRELESSLNARRRFMRECELLERIDSPYVVRVVDAGQSAGGRVYLAMELLGGVSLGARLERGHLSIAEAVGVARRIAEGLTAAHAQGIVHRDLKPDNVFLLPDGGLKILDFGIAGLLDGLEKAGGPAKLTSTGAIIGTPAYISPEAARGQRVTAAADLYSLGVVLYEMLTGSRLFDGDIAVSLMAKHITEPAPDVRSLEPSCPEPLAQLVALLLEKEPGDRPASAAAVARVLAELEEDTDLEAEPTQAAARPLPKAAPPPPTPATLSMQSVEPAPTPHATHRGSLRWWVLPLVALGTALAGGAAWLALRASETLPTSARSIAEPAPASDTGGVPDPAAGNAPSPPAPTPSTLSASPAASPDAGAPSPVDAGRERPASSHRRVPPRRSEPEDDGPVLWRDYGR